MPDQGRESVRDLVRARHGVQKDLLSVRHRITKLVLRYGHRYDKGKTAWTNQFWTWLGKIKLDTDRFILRDLGYSFRLSKKSTESLINERSATQDFIDRRLRIMNTLVFNGGYWIKVRATDGTEGWLPGTAVRAVP